MNLYDYKTSRSAKEEEEREMFRMRVCCTYTTRRSTEEEEERETFNDETRRKITTMEKKFLPRLFIARARGCLGWGCEREKETRGFRT